VPQRLRNQQSFNDGLYARRHRVPATDDPRSQNLSLAPRPEYATPRYRPDAYTAGVQVARDRECRQRVASQAVQRPGHQVPSMFGVLLLEHFSREELTRFDNPLHAVEQFWNITRGVRDTTFVVIPHTSTPKENQPLCGCFALARTLWQTSDAAVRSGNHQQRRRQSRTACFAATRPAARSLLTG